jgi:CcmD family protein
MGEGLGWVMVVNLVLWTGLFLYLLRLGRRLRAAERAAAAAPDAGLER